MATITIRNLDDDLKAMLRVVAANHGRSMEEEAGQIIRQALTKQDKKGGLGSRLHARFSAVGGVDLDVPERNTKAKAASSDDNVLSELMKASTRIWRLIASPPP